MDKYKGKCLSKTILAIMIANTIITAFPSSTNAIESKNKTSTESPHIIPVNDYIDINGDFENTHVITDSFKDFWKDSIKPQKWDLRHHTSAPNRPLGEVIKTDVTSNSNAVKISLDKSSGFLLQSVPVSGGRKYTVSADLKTENLSIDSTNQSHTPFEFRVEELKGDTVLTRHSITKLKGNNNYKTYSKEIKLNPDTTSLKFVFAFDTYTKLGAFGNVFIDNVSLKKEEIKPTSISLDKNEINSSTGSKGLLNYSIEPKDSTSKDVIFTSNNPDIVSINNSGEFKSLKEGEAIITASLKDYPEIKTNYSIKVFDFLPIDKIEFDKTDYSIDLGKNLIINPKISPKDSNESYYFDFSNPSILEYKDEIIKGIKPGTSIVYAKNSSGNIVGKFNLTIKDYKEDKFDKLVNRYYDSLVPNDLLDKNNPSDMEAVKSISNQAEEYLKSMNKSQDRTSLWDEFESTTASTNITKSFERLWTMARAFSLKGSNLEGNTTLLKETISGVNWLLENRYDGKSYYNNWWDFQIGTPQKLNDILVMLLDYLSPEELSKAFNSIDFYVPNARDQWRGNTTVPGQVVTQTVGANRTDMCLVIALRGLLGKDEKKLKEVSPDMMQELKYVDKLDGFYEDGSIIQHTALPYTGTYGSILLSGIGKVSSLLSGSEYNIPEDKTTMMYDIIEKSFEPLMHKGLLMDSVSGRSISRASGQDINNGEGLMKTIVKYYIPAASPKKATELKEMVKYWLVSNDSKDILQTTNDLEFRALAKNIVNDPNIKLRGELLGNWNYANMDRAVQRSKGFQASLSMYSTRTFMHEGGMNGENLKGYHTADGMLYVYNDDLEQFNKNFWPTVDPNRLPGTTVDKTNLKNSSGGDKQRGNSDWVGGSSLGDFGVSGMQLDKKNHKDHGSMDLTAKKSYFFFDNEIVLLGSDINSSTDTNIETIIENRRLINGDEKVTVDGKEAIKDSGDSIVKEDASYVHLNGSKENTSFGYYFPEKTTINLLRDYRTGSYKDINTGQSDSKVSNTFMTMTLDHGIKPKESGYSYVILPNATEKETKNYSKKPDIKILSNTKDIQSVKDKNLNVTAANFWSENGGKIDKVSVNSKASVIYKEKDGILKVGISDPTMKNNGTIRLELNKKFKEPIKLDKGMTLVQTNNSKIIIDVDMSNSKGQTKIAEFKLHKN
ncbi:polysaccharide lyase family 8 super-sandwich domain-containing protein [Clostridium chrysemydis]|uniref:polysaccharide lyase family 8 super-sandwich domain-containing protein n=1 Tax=Clostridium chrysemydis TaxID=2665504 RepID=UPI003F3B3663